jgi:hypothetical protein
MARGTIFFKTEPIIYPIDYNANPNKLANELLEPLIYFLTPLCYKTYRYFIPRGIIFCKAKLWRAFASVSAIFWYS